MIHNKCHRDLLLNESESPFVSVIVPTYNDSERLDKCLFALGLQNYDENRYEVIVVDNGSIDSSEKIIREHAAKRIYYDKIQNSYAARNAGIRHAKGEIYGFTDSDCIPSKGWIREGVRALANENTDLVGGNVSFIFSKSPSSAERIDSSTNMQIEKGIRERGIAKTANLFVKAHVFAGVGTFPENVQSGGDVLWTSAATSKGFRLVYCHEAEIAHPARGLRNLLTKQIRVGVGQMEIFSKKRMNLCSLLWFTLGEFLPPITGMHRSIIATGRSKKIQHCPLWFILWMSRIATSIGRLRGLATRMRRPNRNETLQ